MIEKRKNTMVGILMNLAHTICFEGVDSIGWITLLLPVFDDDSISSYFLSLSLLFFEIENKERNCNLGEDSKM